MISMACGLTGRCGRHSRYRRSRRRATLRCGRRAFGAGREGAARHHRAAKARRVPRRRRAISPGTISRRRTPRGAVTGAEWNRGRPAVARRAAPAIRPISPNTGTSISRFERRAMPAPVASRSGARQTAITRIWPIVRRQMPASASRSDHRAGQTRRRGRLPRLLRAKTSGDRTDGAAPACRRDQQPRHHRQRGRRRRQARASTRIVASGPIGPRAEPRARRRSVRHGCARPARGPSALTSKVITARCAPVRRLARSRSIGGKRIELVGASKRSSNGTTPSGRFVPKPHT